MTQRIDYINNTDRLAGIVKCASLSREHGTVDGVAEYLRSCGVSISESIETASRIYGSVKNIIECCDTAASEGVGTLEKAIADSQMSNYDKAVMLMKLKVSGDVLSGYIDFPEGGISALDSIVGEEMKKLGDYTDETVAALTSEVARQFSNVCITDKAAKRIVGSFSSNAFIYNELREAMDYDTELKCAMAANYWLCNKDTDVETVAAGAYTMAELIKLGDAVNSGLVAEQKAVEILDGLFGVTVLGIVFAIPIGMSVLTSIQFIFASISVICGMFAMGEIEKSFPSWLGWKVAAGIVNHEKKAEERKAREAEAAEYASNHDYGYEGYGEDIQRERVLDAMMY